MAKTHVCTRSVYQTPPSPVDRACLVPDLVIQFYSRLGKCIRDLLSPTWARFLALGKNILSVNTKKIGAL
jgi:hypothetical protein